MPLYESPIDRLVREGKAVPVDPEHLREREARWTHEVAPELERHLRENVRRAAKIRDIPLF